MAIEVFILQPEPGGGSPPVVEIAITRDDMEEVGTILHEVGTEKAALAVNATPNAGTPEDNEARSRAALHTGILLDAMHEVRTAHRDGDEVIRLTGAPLVGSVLLGSLVRGLEVKAQDATQAGATRLTYRTMSKQEYEAERANRTEA